MTHKSKFIKSYSIFCIVYRRIGQSQQKAFIQWYRVNRKLTQANAAQREQGNLSNVSQTKHTAALGMVTKVFSGVGKVRVPETKTLTSSRPYP